jgi:hypothetical protein
MAMTSSIRAEWDIHQSRFARTWRLSMMARKKIQYVEVDPHHSLQRRLPRAAKDPSILAIMEKDRHLLEAALVTDRRVVSLDEKVREHFRAHQPALREVREICWVNPEFAEQELLAWLERGAPADRSLMLGHLPTESEQH